MKRVALLCGSRKPGPGIDRPSATRKLLLAVQAGLQDEGAEWEQLDLRELDVPQFDGRTCEQYGSPDLELVRRTLDESDVVVLSAPAYWNSISGPVINLLNVLGGANYDPVPDRFLPLAGRTVILLVVGADHSSAYLGAAQLRQVLTAMGATVPPTEVVIGNPRQVPNMAAVVSSVRELGRYAARVNGG
ncbi:NADPH-dependent FMN reductase [Kitasatospora mediocidica]|uniref:NADPH-dependent FMN reductase n=1 Tax=Kitasatospora mediocidica TaxID=58352 RepID=UPI00068D3FD1|nr:NAD(P)H-dependent oxidoreductase [Kitasatospora mediocidica]